MRLAYLFDALYVVGSLAGPGSASPVCSSGPVASAVTARRDASVRAITTAFVDVAVITMDAQRVLPNQTVVIKDGWITALGPVSQVPVPAGAVRIDGRGKYLMPGLTDMHTHFLMPGVPIDASLLFSFLAAGITAVRHTEPFPADSMQAFRRSAVAALSPYIYIASRIKESSRAIRITEFARPGMSAESVATAYRAAGHNFLLMPTERRLPDSVLVWAMSMQQNRSDSMRLALTTSRSSRRRERSDSIQAAAVRLGLPRAVHEPHDGPFDEMLALGRGTAVDHLYRFWSALGLAEDRETRLARRKVEEVSTSEIQPLVAKTKAAGIWITPTLFCMSRNDQTDPRSIFLRKIVKTLQDEGVGLLLAGDDGGDVHDELTALVQAGLTPYQALLTGTRNVAQHLGVLDERGTIAVGKRADLVLLYGNPLEDIRHTREPAGVMRNGRWFDRVELDQRLLASPKTWFTLHLSETAIRIGGRPGLLVMAMDKDQALNASKHVLAFEALADSLEAAKTLGHNGASAYERLLRSLMNGFGAFRALLTPEQRIVFDPLARVWLREHARQGYQLTVPGVAPAPW